MIKKTKHILYHTCTQQRQFESEETANSARKFNCHPQRLNLINEIALRKSIYATYITSFINHNDIDDMIR